MKTWTDLSAVEKPMRIARLEQDARGFPVFFTAMVENGKPDFRTVDPAKWRQAASNSLCGICGESLGKTMAFVGGPKSIKNRYFTDLPMHISCAEYALKVCPFLAMPKFGYLEQSGQDRHVNTLVTTKRPDLFGLGVTNKMKILELHGEVVVRAGRFTRVHWWKHGAPTDERPSP